MSRRGRRLEPRKLLAATAGVATINYLAVSCLSESTSGNLVAPAFDSGAARDPDVVEPDGGSKDAGADAGSRDSGAP